MSLFQDDQSLVDGVRAGDARAVSRLISLCENGIPRARDIQNKLYADAKPAQLIGVTGAPGSGKSTLVDCLAKHFRDQGNKVAILAIDPSSPFSGGAVLGDRIRMVNSSEYSDIFIRSMATRGALGGLSTSCQEALQVLEAAGYDQIFIETVGVGQAEVDIVKTADTCLVVLVPGMGDSVQAIKAGVMEIADIFVINKADRDGADLLHKDIRLLLSLNESPKDGWEIDICRTTATKNEGTAELADTISSHRKWLESSDAGEARRVSILKERIERMVQDSLVRGFFSSRASELEQLSRRCAKREISPGEAARVLLKDQNFS